jgi:hypothetical protein
MSLGSILICPRCMKHVTDRSSMSKKLSVNTTFGRLTPTPLTPDERSVVNRILFARDSRQIGIWAYFWQIFLFVVKSVQRAHSELPEAIFSDLTLDEYSDLIFCVLEVSHFKLPYGCHEIH